ncbi:MAG: carboxylesterase family protein [Eubacterium sp.]|nr:carboxylesterase family protein [Eubacterium sp.]
MEIKIVETAKGKVKGYLDHETYTFKGIPYAKAKRFHDPKPADAWKDVFDATSYGYVCPLMNLPKPGGELLVAHRYWPMDEDCLNLNVWTPGCDHGKRPVFVWLHGGGFEEGSAIEQVAYEGTNMSREGNVVVVSVNHRLNILGFCDLSAFGAEYENSGNAGITDLVFALKWIQENIAAFGGDPAQVTIAGQSGGGAKVTALLQTPAADGLYSRAVNMSGVLSGLLTDCKGSGEALGRALMAELSIQKIQELETVPYHKLFAAYQKIKPILQEKGENIGCAPYQNAFYAGDPLEKGFRKETAHIPMMVGSCFAEFAGFMPPAFDRSTISEEEGIRILYEVLGEETGKKLLPLFQNAYPGQTASDLLMLDTVFRSAGQKYILERRKLNTCTYSYIFNVVFPIEGGRLAWHCADLPFLFHNTDLLAVTRSDPDMKETEKQLFSAVMSFMRTGSPMNAALPEWGACTAEAEKCMVIGKKTQLRVNHDKELISEASEALGALMIQRMRENMDKVQH